MKIFDAPLGIITNAPSYDWHETNLRNYINLSPVALPGKKIEDLNFKPLGGGSGMIGLPGDFTPPSRFVRAVAFSKTARPTPTGDETIYEVFRILDNFNVSLGASEGTGEDKTQGMRGSTIWTSASDTNNKSSITTPSIIAACGWSISKGSTLAAIAKLSGHGDLPCPRNGTKPTFSLIGRSSTML
jgi:choloylglycine hydrolase